MLLQCFDAWQAEAAKKKGKGKKAGSLQGGACLVCRIQGLGRFWALVFQGFDGLGYRFELWTEKLGGTMKVYRFLYNNQERS